MVDVTTDIHIHRPLQEVVAYAANPENAPEWYVNILSMQWRTPKPLAVGSRVDFRARFMGRELAYTYEVVELEAQKMVMNMAEGPFPMETTYTWEAVSDEQTHMFLRNVGSPKGFGRVFRPVVAAVIRRANNKDLRRLKRILEGRATASPA